MGATSGLTISITATDRASMELQLDEAVAAAAAAAAGSIAMHEKRHGILVTRHDYHFFTVALSEAVPFGLTHEHED